MDNNELQLEARDTQGDKEPRGRSKLAHLAVVLALFFSSLGAIAVNEVVQAEPAHAASGWVTSYIGNWNCPAGMHVARHLTSYVPGTSYGSWKSGNYGWWKWVPLNRRIQVTVKIHCKGSGVNWWRQAYRTVWVYRYFSSSHKSTYI